MIRVDNIGKSYASGRRQVRALHAVSLRVETGQSAAIVGKSGSGKYL